jgi:hypothetical protein
VTGRISLSPRSSGSPESSVGFSEGFSVDSVDSVDDASSPGFEYEPVSGATTVVSVVTPWWRAAALVKKPIAPKTTTASTITSPHPHPSTHGSQLRFRGGGACPP